MEESKVSYGSGYAINKTAPDNIIGEICQIIEILGLKEIQEKQVKSLIKKSVWNVFQDFGIYISSEKHTELREEHLTNKCSQSKH